MATIAMTGTMKKNRDRCVGLYECFLRWEGGRNSVRRLVAMPPQLVSRVYQKRKKGASLVCQLPLQPEVSKPSPPFFRFLFGFRLRFRQHQQPRLFLFDREHLNEFIVTCFECRFSLSSSFEFGFQSRNLAV